MQALVLLHLKPRHSTTLPAMTVSSPNESQRTAERLARITYRECPDDDPCECTPCRHLWSYDPDRLEDVQDFFTNRPFHDMLWKAFFRPQYRQALSPENLAEVDQTLDRCRRIKEKEPEIKAEERYRQALMFIKDGADEKYLRRAEARVEALEEKLGKRFEWYNRDREASESKV
jgi:hypothetical protein